MMIITKRRIDYQENRKSPNRTWRNGLHTEKTFYLLFMFLSINLPASSVLVVVDGVDLKSKRNVCLSCTGQFTKSKDDRSESECNNVLLWIKKIVPTMKTRFRTTTGWVNDDDRDEQATSTRFPWCETFVADVDHGNSYLKWVSDDVGWMLNFLVRVPRSTL